MQKYVLLGNWTDRARETFLEIPERVKLTKNIIGELKGSIDFFFTMGEYDFVAIIDMPDEESMVKYLFKAYEARYITIKTLRAWTDNEFAEMVTEI
ncbi:GYD domain-containing protein [Methanobacterium formicicum]|uniref:GYD family protein n=1 Tax=Methanobacterium formicicum (strain DSM 3637 / PP1) TaxID=1204725 RepID=K2QF72_METFP|nr:GYD domain-containing protein [Methanobacterium formicicum]EKF86741.1 GYD family protein [Methanobacterium formicicum DSM 3637]